MFNRYDRKVFVVMFKMIMELLFIVIYVLAAGTAKDEVATKQIEIMDRQYRRLKPALRGWVNEDDPREDTERK